MRLVNRDSPTSGGAGSPDSVTTFVVLESGTCQVPAIPRPTNGLANVEYDHDYMPDIYSYPLHEEEAAKEQNGKVVNMRVDIKVKVSPGHGTVAPPSTPATGLFTRPLGGAVAPPSTPTNSMTDVTNVSPDVTNPSWHESVQVTDNDVTADDYTHHARTTRITLRNRSAPPVMSQYRTRLTTTPQWIKKRAVAELTSVRNLPKERPSTSVRPFSERDSPDETNPYMARVCLQPPQHPSRVSVPDFGSFRGKPPISVPTKLSIGVRRTTVRKGHTQNSETRGPTGEKTIHTAQFSRNKVEQYVSELRKSIKLRKPGENGRSRLTPYAVWAISNSEEVSNVNPELAKFENEPRSKEIIGDLPPGSPTGTRNSAQTKGNNIHTVRREVIKQITDHAEEKENVRRRHLLEVKGDIPPGIPQKDNDVTSNRGKEPFQENSNGTDIAISSRGFPRAKTTLSSAAHRGTLRYTRQFAVKNDSSSANSGLLENDILQRNISQSPNASKRVSHKTTLPYLQLRQSVVGDYRAYKQNATPFVRTLI